MVFVVVNHKGIFFKENNMEENWMTVVYGVKINDDGILEIDTKKLLEKANKLRAIKPSVKKYDIPTLVKVKMKKYYGSYTNEAKKKQVICLDTNEVFESSKAACKFYKLSTSALCECLKGRKANAAGYRWAYYTE